MEKRPASEAGGIATSGGQRCSGYEIGFLRALQAVVGHLDRTGRWPALGEDILHALQWNEPDDLIDWVKNADKAEVAALAMPVFAAAGKGDRMARKILDAAAASLAGDGVDCAKRLAKPGAAVEFILSGSILLQQGGMARKVGARLRQLWPGARITPLPRESTWGAIELAKAHFGGGKLGRVATNEAVAEKPFTKDALASSPLPPTEQSNPRSQNLDRLPLAEAVALR